jgi:hypothetical protein
MDTMEQKWTYALWGVAVGAAMLAVAGFTLGGWVTGGKAEAMANSRAQTALVAVLTPICIEKFQASANAPANLKELKHSEYSWTRRDYIVKGGWATFGQTRPFELADACADALNKL